MTFLFLEQNLEVLVLLGLFILSIFNANVSFRMNSVLSDIIFRL